MPKQLHTYKGISANNTSNGNAVNVNVFIEIDRGETLITSDVPCRCTAGYECVMCRGKAIIVEETNEKCRALKAIMRVQTGKEYEINEKMAAAVSIIRVDVESYTAKAHV